MTKLQPIWQHLPLYFKTDVVGFLDFKSRFSLQKCSKSDHQLVEKSPIFIQKLIFSIQNSDSPKNQIILKIDDSLKMESNFSNSTKIFANFFKNSNSRVKILEFQNSRKADPVKINRIIKKIIATFQKNPKNSKIKVFEFHWDISQSFDFLKLFFHFVDPKIIRKFKIQNKFEQGEFEILSTSEHWKNLKSAIFLNSLENLDFRKFLSNNLEQFEVSKRNVTPEEIWMVIESFRHRNLPPRSYFTIFSSSYPPIQVDQMFRFFQVPMKHAPVDERDLMHTQRFSVRTDDELILIVRFSEFTIRGVICRVGGVAEDYEAVLEIGN